MEPRAVRVWDTGVPVGGAVGTDRPRLERLPEPLSATHWPVAQAAWPLTGCGRSPTGSLRGACTLGRRGFQPPLPTRTAGACSWLTTRHGPLLGKARASWQRVRPCTRVHSAAALPVWYWAPCLTVTWLHAEDPPCLLFHPPCPSSSHFLGLRPPPPHPLRPAGPAGGLLLRFLFPLFRLHWSSEQPDARWVSPRPGLELLCPSSNSTHVCPWREWNVKRRPSPGVYCSLKETPTARKA